MDPKLKLEIIRKAVSYGFGLITNWVEFVIGRWQPRHADLRSIPADAPEWSRDMMRRWHEGKSSEVLRCVGDHQSDLFRLIDASWRARLGNVAAIVLSDARKFKLANMLWVHAEKAAAEVEDNLTLTHIAVSRAARWIDQGNLVAAARALAQAPGKTEQAYLYQKLVIASRRADAAACTLAATNLFAKFSERHRLNKYLTKDDDMRFYLSLRKKRLAQTSGRNRRWQLIVLGATLLIGVAAATPTQATAIKIGG